MAPRPQPQQPSGSLWYLQPLMLLCTGTLVVIANQNVTNQAAVAAKAQLLTLVRYMFTFGLSATLYYRQKFAQAGRKQPQGTKHQQHPAPATPRKTKLLLLALGCIDVSCYAIYNLGFSLCGSALATVVLAASGQIATAAISVTVLHRQLRFRHIAAVATVTFGLVLRSMDDILAKSTSSSKASGDHTQQQTYGVACVMLSALLFSVLGCVYELLMQSDQGPGKVSQAEASFTITGVSLIASLAHQLIYTVPNAQELVLKPLAASQTSPTNVAAAHALYGLITAVHHYVQLRLLASHGAMTVGLVNAVRASVVSFVSSWLFCGAEPHLCITYWRAISAFVVSIGAVQWVIAGKPLAPSDEGVVAKKQQ